MPKVHAFVNEQIEKANSPQREKLAALALSVKGIEACQSQVASTTAQSEEIADLA